VLPFRGLRFAAPSSELDRLVSPPYDVISPDEQVQLRELSPHNAVYVELPQDVPGEPGSRHRLAAEKLVEWRRAGVLGADPRPAYYLSETQVTHAGETRRRRDLLAAVMVEPWSSGAVLPHEHTMPGPKADRLDLLRATHLNASPIWLLQREQMAGLEHAWAATEAMRPTAEFTWRGEQHRLWVVDDPATVDAIQAGFERSGPLYIADGHHRYETSLAFAQEARSNVRGAGATLATVPWADDPGLLALPTHRVLRGLESLTLEEAEARWSDVFHGEYYPIWENAPAEQIDAMVQQLPSSGRAAPKTNSCSDRICAR